MNLIELNIDKIIALCKKYKVDKLFVFGSILTNRFSPESDVDFVVRFNKSQITDYFSNFFDLKYALEDILGRRVDLVEEQAIRNHYLKENIERTKALVYG
ncbi:MAG: nucleotidyltransferase domain-containing protein [Marinifilaceae bacterium]|nr:nucleotidyltransferase domain-containing protein [Marinifilaceae bacterium]